jgi:hypothetical protein
MGQLGRATRLAILAVAGQSVAYILTIVLARQLTVDGFESYAVASAAFTLMVMYTPRGLEKYALRLLPALFEREDWATYFSDYSEAIKLAIAVSCLSLPAGALVHYYVEVLSANGQDVIATAIFRIGVPATVLSLVGAIIYLPIQLNGAVAVGSWGLAWLLMLFVIAIIVRKTVS